MKATMSRDGVLRFTIRIKARVGSDTLIDAVRWAADRGREFKKTRSGLIALARDAVAHEGDGLWAQAQDTHTHAISYEAAAKIVCELFPELMK
jgi:hypothetical protein